MSRRGNQSSHRGFYSLSEVKDRIRCGQVLVRSNAMRSAFADFGWGIQDVKNAYLQLRMSHYYKTDSSKVKPGVALDFYKACIEGEYIYTHFYIDDLTKTLVINSFKQM